jgi:hypothetical protein
MMTEEEMINQTIIGKRIVAVAWVPLSRTYKNAFDIESITLEGGVTLKLYTNFFDTIVVAEIEENDHADV